MNTFPSHHHRRHGFSLLECLMLILILGIVGASAGRMLQSQAKMPRDSEAQFEIDTALVSKMETLRGLTFAQLTVGTAPNSFCDTVTIGNATCARNVTIALADANGDGVAESSLKLITVQVGGKSLSSLVNQP